MTSWKARSLRLTVFVASEASEKAAALGWQDIVGEKPETEMNRGQLQVGPLPPGQLVLQKQGPTRVDMVYAGIPQEGDSSDDPIATLGPFEPAYETFRTLALRVFEKVGPVLRLALGTELVTGAKDVKSAYDLLLKHIRSTSFDLNNASEFVYQINRARPSRIVSGLKVNRLVKWHASAWQSVQLEIGAATRTVTGKLNVGAVITTDINSEAERVEPLPADRIAALLDELRDLTAEVRERGDIA